MPGFFFLGSPKIATTISMSGNASVTNEMVVYAPESNINISSNATWKGVIVGKQINMSGNGHVEQDAGYELPPEINPITPIKEKLKVLEEIERIPVESMSEEQVRIEVQKIVQKWEEEETKRTNTAAVYFTPQSYFECTGTTPVGGVPNANC